ncbi:MAG: response regulator [Bacteroidota bacterium]
MTTTSRSAGKKAVLIVEDSMDFSNLLKFIVEDDGFEGVQFPVHSDDITGWAKEHNAVVILMDLALGRKGGMDFIERLKDDPETVNIPIIIISGRDLPFKEIMALQARGVRYLRKGRVEMDEIRETIKEVVAATPAGTKVKKK